MKKHTMHIIETDGVINGSIDVNYVKVGTDYHAGYGLPVHHKKILSERTAEVDIFEIGDRIQCEILRGFSTDEDGISTGGQWIQKTGTVQDTHDGGYCCYVVFDDGDEQIMSAIAGEKTGIVRNSQAATHPAESKKGMNEMNRDFLKNAKKWEKAGKKRFYLNLTGSLKKASVYWTEDESDRSRYTLELAGGYINASKCYNGSLQEKVAELGGTGELI